MLERMSSKKIPILRALFKFGNNHLPNEYTQYASTCTCSWPAFIPCVRRLTSQSKTTNKPWPIRVQTNLLVNSIAFAQDQNIPFIFSPEQ